MYFSIYESKCVVLIAIVKSIRHTLLMSGPHFANAPLLEPRWQTRRRFGFTLVARLRVLVYGSCWKPDIITPSKHYKYHDRPRRPDRGPDPGQEQPPSTTPALAVQMQHT